MLKSVWKMTIKKMHANDPGKWEGTFRKFKRSDFCTITSGKMDTYWFFFTESDIFDYGGSNSEKIFFKNCIFFLLKIDWEWDSKDLKFGNFIPFLHHLFHIFVTCCKMYSCFSFEQTLLLFFNPKKISLLTG